MVTACSYDESTRCQNPEQQHHNLDRRENVKSNVFPVQNSAALQSELRFSTTEPDAVVCGDSNVRQLTVDCGIDVGIPPCVTELKWVHVRCINANNEKEILQKQFLVRTK